MSPIPGIIASSQTAATLSSYESIATLAGTGSSGTISFTNIPSGYKHLQIRFIGKSTQGGTAGIYIPNMTFNNDTIANYAAHNLRTTGSTIFTDGKFNDTNLSWSYAVIPNSATSYANMHAVGVLDIIDYASTSKNKTVRAFVGVDTDSTGSNSLSLFSGLWYATPAAINRIDITITTGSWTTTSSFALYGIKG